MDVGAVTGGSTAQSLAGSAQSAATADYNTFLQLLVAQMKNQDPTNPMDSTEYISQLATFSSVEQQTKMNAKLDELLISTALSQADALIGRTLTSADGSVSGKVVELRLLSGSQVAVLEGGAEITLGPGIRIR